MPNAYSVSGKSAGDQISSSDEGRYLTFFESELTHPVHDPVDVLVHKGDPVLVGDVIVGVALKTAKATTDLIAIDTEGVWVLEADATDFMGGAIVVGDAIYAIPSSVVLNNISAGTRFGYALTGLTFGGTGNIIIKVHCGGK